MKNIVSGCVELEYHCSDGMCIDMARKCDGVPDCEFEDDEKECNNGKLNLTI
jgi:hypothetical protein